MRVDVVSDTHSDMWDTPFQYNRQDATVLLLCGDVGNGPSETHEEWERALEAGYEHVIFVPGNHEFYDDEADVWGELSSNACRFPNVHLLGLDDFSVTIDGQTFAGCVGWYDFSLTPQDKKYWRQGIADSRFLSDKWVLAEGKRERARMEEAILAADGKVIVATHVPPTKRIQLPPDHRWAVFNGSFYSGGMDELRQRLKDKIAAWAFGHTHHYHLFEEDGMMMICAPRGYPVKHVKGWEPRKLIFTFDTKTGDTYVRDSE